MPDDPKGFKDLGLNIRDFSERLRKAIAQGRRTHPERIQRAIKAQEIELKRRRTQSEKMRAMRARIEEVKELQRKMIEEANARAQGQKVKGRTLMGRRMRGGGGGGFGGIGFSGTGGLVFNKRLGRYVFIETLK